MAEFEIADTTRLSRPSLAQVKAVVEFIQKHPNLAHKGLRNGVKNEKVQNLWSELANIVNSIKGAVKTTKGWIKFWSDKRRNIMMKQKQINSGEIVGKLTSLEQKIFEIAKSRRKKSQKPQLCNGNDDSGDDNPEDDNDMDLQVDTDRMLPSEAAHLNIMEKMVDAMDEQATALAKMAQATVIKSKAMERMADASHKQEIGYSSLRVLDLSYNLIFWIGLHAFAGLNDLTNLDLSNNRLRFITSDVFWETPKLEILDLSSNVFEKVKNEPFIMHEKLQVLNLNNCRIKSLPERLFSRLPNLKKLDLSENYIVTITVAVLKPIRKLERLELRNEYWQCNPDFIAVETWILTHNIKYEKQCKKKSHQKSEKIISMVIERESVDIDKVWNIAVENKTLPVNPNDTKPLTPFQKFDRDFSAVQAFVIGVEIGLAIGIVGTYLWLRCVCSWRNLLFSRPRAQRRRRNRRTEGDIRANLLWNNVISPDLETPPLYRRQISLPERNPPFPIFGIAGLQVDAIREDNRAETPPPPYNECRLNI